MKYIIENFSEFEDTLKPINEKFNSAILRDLLSQEAGNDWRTGLATELNKKYNLALDQISDVDFEIIEPGDWWRQGYHKTDQIGFFVTHNPEFFNKAKGDSSTKRYATPAAKRVGLITTILMGKNAMWHGWKDSNPKGYRSQMSSTERYGVMAKEYRYRESLFGAKVNVTKNNVIEFSDKVYVLDLPKIRDKYSTIDLKKSRAEAKKGAIAFMSDKQFIADNKERYRQILANRAASTPVDKEVLAGLDILNKLIADGISNPKSGEQYGSQLIVGTDPNGRDIRLTDATRFINNLLSDYEDYIRYGNDYERIKKEIDGQGGRDFMGYEARMKQAALDIKNKLIKIKKLDIAW